MGVCDGYCLLGSTMGLTAEPGHPTHFLVFDRTFSIIRESYRAPCVDSMLSHQISRQMRCSRKTQAACADNQNGAVAGFHHGHRHVLNLNSDNSLAVIPAARYLRFMGPGSAAIIDGGAAWSGSPICHSRAICLWLAGGGSDPGGWRQRGRAHAFIRMTT